MSDKNASRDYTPWLIGLSVFLLIISFIAFFITANVYDSERFAKNTTDAITSEPARDAIATEITEALLEEESAVANFILTEPVEALISGLLDTKIASGIFYEFSYQLNRVLVTNDFEPVTINVGEIASTIDTVVNTLQPDNNLDLSGNIQNEEITLFDNNDLPPFKTIGQVLLIVGPLSLIAVISIAIVSYSKLDDRRKLLNYAGITFAITGALLLVFTFTSGAVLTVSIIDPERSTIMQEIFNSFISTFRFMMILLVLVGIGMSGYYRYKFVEPINSLAKK